MERFLIIKICLVIFLSGNSVVSIMTGHERTPKYDAKLEDREWVTNIGPPAPHEEKYARQSQISLNSLCPSGVTGQFPYPEDCKRFINCWKGRGMIQVCAPGTLFNPASGECDYPDKVNCEGHGYYASPQPLVSRFPNQRPEIGQNPRVSRKDKENYETGPQVIRPYPGRPPYFGPSHLTRPTPRPTRPTRPTRTGAKLQEKVECPRGLTGLHPHPTDCTKFLNCYIGGMFVQKCGPGTYFNPSMSICDHMQPNGCGSNEEITGHIPRVPPPQDVEVVEENTKKDDIIEEQYPPLDDLYNSGTNLFDVRAGEEEDVEEAEESVTPTTDKPVATVKQNAESDGKKDRDPSWGKILNWGNSKPQTHGGNTLFYDAHGNPVSSDRFWSQIGKPQHHNSQQPEQQRPATEQSAAGDSNVYYFRPHNHVMNQYPPHLQNNAGTKPPIFHNPQSYPQIVRTDRDPPFNPYYPSPPTGSPVAGHFILVDSAKPLESKKVYDQSQREPAPYLVPPNEDFKPVRPGASNRYGGVAEPSSVLLPPRPDTQNHQHFPHVENQPQQQHSVHAQNQPNRYNPGFGLDYSNWKPFYGETVTPTHSTTEKPNDLNLWNELFEPSPPVTFENRRKVNHDKSPASEPTKEVSPDRWNYKAQSSNVTGNVGRIPTTTRTTDEHWSPYFENKNPYGLSSRTSSAATEPTQAPTTTTTVRVYPVYVVYPTRNNGTEYGSQKVSQSSHYVAETEKPVNQYVPQKAPHIKKGTDDGQKKRIQSEAEIADSEENWDVDILPFDELLPGAGKRIRLKPLSTGLGRYHLDGYVEMKKPNGEWGLVCDKSNSWMIYEANVACKQLGYGRGAQISWQGYPLDTSTESIPVAVNEIRCRGNEESLEDCFVQYGDAGCDITENAVGLRCFDNVTTQCHPEEVEFNNSCYRLVRRDDFDEAGLTIDEAAEFCNKIGGRISDVISQEENDFLSQWLTEKHPDVRSVLTGGIGSTIMGRSLWMWFSSKVPMTYQNWWKGWADEKKIKQGNVHEPMCVVLRNSFPCYTNNDEDAEFEIELGNLEPEYCSANYFYWDVEKCKNLKNLKLPHLCKKPLEDIGCVSGRGETYSGKASVTSSGSPCLPWDDPEVKTRLAHRITLQEWTTKLSGHNFCRNLGRQELHPWCFVEGKENSEYCSIPQCSDSVPGYSKSVVGKSSCDETQFECKLGECIERRLFCDGKRDCSNGRDEAMCSIFLQEFTKTPQKRMSGRGKEEWPDVNENNCAKLCLESKKFTCKSFSYHNGQRRCLLSDSNIGTSGQVIDEPGWTYYELSVLSLNCSNKAFKGCKNGKCVRALDVCNGKDDCGDKSDEEDCERLGYKVRLTGGNVTGSGRLEIKISDEWGGVCFDKFTSLAGHVACKELGFKHGFAGFVKNSSITSTSGLGFLIDEVKCIGNETGLRECSSSGWDGQGCSSGEAVSVSCRIAQTHCPDDEWLCRKSEECIQIRYLCDKVYDCDDRSDEDEKMCNEPVKLRLAGGPNATSGRLEVKYSGTWGTICDDNFNDAAASVICRTLGYLGPARAIKNAFYGPGKGPIWLDGIRCIGNETNVDQCSHEEWGSHNCKHDEDISISCSTLGVNQKASNSRPVAASSGNASEMTSIAKLRQALIRECSDKKAGKLEKISTKLEPRERVVDSNVVHEGIPWQASIRVRSKDGKSTHWCGAIVLSPYHILTAGHCVRDYSKPAYVVRVGDFDTERNDQEEREFSIDHLYMHPEFNHGLQLNNDIALIKVKGEIQMGKRVRPACLVPSTDVYVPGTNCSISGWGSVTQDSRGYAKTLRRGYVPILEPSLCRSPAVYGDTLSDGMFCAGHLEGGADSCQGDSGGPMTCEYEGREYLFGITSWGHGCGKPNKPGVYTNVAYYADWLQEKIEISMA